MTRAELAARLARRFPDLAGTDFDQVVTEILKAMQASLERGGRVEIRGFGRFRLNYRQPRLARNPKSGKILAVPGKWVPHFKPGKGLRDQVQVAAEQEASGLLLLAA